MFVRRDSWTRCLQVAGACLLSVASFVGVPVTGVVASGADAAAEATAEGTEPFEIVHRLGGLIEAFVSDGERLYLGIGSRLVLLDANTVSGVPEGGTQAIHLPHTIQDAATLGGGMVAALAGNVVFFVDAVDPDAMALVGTYDPGVRLGGIESWGSTVYLLGDDELLLVDASRPAAPMRVGALRLPDASGVRSQMLAGDGVVFLGRPGVTVVDVSAPRSPRLIGGIEEGVAVSHMAVSGRRLYVHDGTDRFDGSGNRIVGVFVYVLDVEPDGTITHHGVTTLIDAVPTPPRFQVAGIIALDDRLFVSGSETDWETFRSENQVRGWDMTSPSAPVALPIVGYPRLGSAVALVASAGRVFVASNDAALVPDYRYQSPGVGVVDVTDPAKAEWKGFWQLDDLGAVSFLAATSRNVTIREGHSPLIHTYDGLYEAGAPRTGYIYTEMWATNLRATSDRVYTIGSRHLVVYDIGDLARPRVLATALVTTSQTALAIDEPYVYTHVGCNAISEPGREPYCTLITLEVVDSGGAASVQELAQVPVGEIMRDVAVANGYAYVIAQPTRAFKEFLDLYDVRNPARPTRVGHHDLGEDVWAKRTVVRDGLAYVATRTLADGWEPVATGLTILNVADAPAVSIVGSLALESSIEESTQPRDRGGHLALSGDYALYSCDEPFVHVVDVSDPANPAEVQRIEAPAKVVDIDAALGRAYVVSKDGGMLVLRATDGTRPPHRARQAYLPVAIAPSQR